MEKIRVFNGISHERLRRILSSLLSGTPDIELVSETEDEHVNFDLVMSRLPDVVLMDLTSRAGGATDTLHAIQKVVPGVKIVVLLDYDLELYEKMVIGMGASGFLRTQDVVSDLIPEVRRVYKKRTMEVVRPKKV